MKNVMVKLILASVFFSQATLCFADGESKVPPSV
jgi:hypothetical protein